MTAAAHNPPTTPPPPPAPPSPNWLRRCLARCLAIAGRLRSSFKTAVQKLIISIRRRPDTHIALAALVVGVVAAGIAYASYTNDKAASSARPPASSTPPVTPKPSPSRPTQTTTLPVLAELYEHCSQLVRSVDKVFGYSGRPLRGVVTIVNGDGTTTLMSDGTATWTCNLKPDLNVAGPGPIDGVSLSEKDKAFALSRASVEERPYADQIFWGGGALRLGTASVRFVFPDGHRVPATIKNGYWLLQYRYRFPPGMARGSKLRPILVEELAAAGYVRGGQELRWDNEYDLCNHLSGGC